MDIQQIKYFSRVYEMRSFTQAADSLFISRQALRKSVARLAQEMGEPLFENRGNVLFPTSAADLLFSASRPVLSAFAQTKEPRDRAFWAIGGGKRRYDLGRDETGHRLFLDKRARD